jgi:carbon-monoxide dehydrogenase large subunit
MGGRPHLHGAGRRRPGGGQEAAGRTAQAGGAEARRTWTGQFKITRVVYSHDTGKVINPFVAVSDMEGSFMQSFQVATNSIPYDKEFPGQMHNSIAFLSFPIPTIMEFPEAMTQVFIESLEPRWFYGYKGFSETSIGSVPGAIGNAIYNATGVRVSHPISAERILMGLKKLKEAV